MGKDEPQYRKKINQKQLELLHVLYRFRFATTDLIAKYQGKKNGTSVYPRLITLVEQGYVGRNFEPEYRKRDQHASYFLLSKGVSALKQRSDKSYNPKVLHNIYGDKDASEQFILDSITVFEAYCTLKAHYGDKLQFFTRSDLSGFEHDHFPNPLPDAYLRLEGRNGVNQYFLDVHNSEPIRPFFKSSQRIKQYAAHVDSKKWKLTGEPYPKILALCDTQTLQKRVLKRVARENNLELSFLLTVKKAILNIGQGANIWQPADRPDDVESLETA